MAVSLKNPYPRSPRVEQTDMGERGRSKVVDVSQQSEDSDRFRGGGGERKLDLAVVAVRSWII